MKVVHCRKDEYDVYIGRPSHWGNPFSHNKNSRAEYIVDTREEAIQLYEEWLRDQPEMMEKARKELKGKILGCWCDPSPCHGEVLMRIANE